MATTNQWAIQWGDAEAFLRALFAPDDAVELRAARTDHEKGHAEHCLARDLTTAGIRGWLEDHNGPGWLLCVGVNPRKPGRGSGAGGACVDADVLLARSIWVDMDACSLEEACKRRESSGLPEPTLTVSSGGGVHFYWCFEAPITDLAVWQGYQRRAISLMGSDHTIKNASRIMRLPGSFNHKRNAPCRLAFTGQRYLSVESLGVQPLEEAQRYLPEGGAISRPAVMESLSRNTLLFLTSGAPEGQRNTALFSAACDMAGCGFNIGDATKMLSAKARESGLADFETEAVIRRAFSKPRAPARPVEEPIDLQQAERDLNSHKGYINAPPTDVHSPHPSGGEAAPETKPPTGQPKREAPPEERIARPIVSNAHTFLKSAGGKVEEVTVGKPIEQIAIELHDATGGWPRRSAATGLFGLKTDEKGRATLWNIFEPDDLYAYVHDRASLRWTEGECQTANGERVSAVTKREFFKWARENLKPSYDGVATLPHYPERPGTFYIPNDLPEPTGERLAEFIAALNPATELDRDLMLAALLTPGWGGPPGARPLFVFTSEFGQGSGKTETAKAFGRVWGGACPCPYEESWANIAKGIMSSDKWLSRVFLFDNVKGRFGGGAIESAVTAEHLTGHKMYVGTISRPNDAVFYLTFNLPEMTRDLAQRSVLIRLGPPKGEGFVEWAANFIAEHQAQLVSDLLALLAAPAKCEIEPGNRDRWRAWQQAILTRFEHGNALAKMILDRRVDTDADSEDAGDLLRAIANHLVARGRGPDRGPEVEVTAAELVATASRAGLWRMEEGRGDTYNNKRCMAYVRAKLLGRAVLFPVMLPGGDRQRRCRVNDQGEAVAGVGAAGRVSAVFRWVWASASSYLDGSGGWEASGQMNLPRPPDGPPGSRGAFEPPGLNL